MSSCGSVTYGVAKELAKILKPLVGKSPHHINSTQDFVEQAKHITLAPGECLSSYDVSALFTSVPVDPALNIIKDLLEKDHTLKERTVMEVSDIILLLEFCLKNTYFSFQDQSYEQVEDAAMGSPVSPIVANHYMEYLEQKALTSAIHHHSSQTGHPTNHNNFQIIGREGHNLARNIKESIYIRVNNPTLNNNIGKFNLSHIWDRVLLNTKGLTLNKQGNNNNNQPN